MLLMHFYRYVLERYVHVLLGRSHLEIAESQKQHSVPPQHQHLHITPFELHGLKAIVMYLHSLPSTKKNVPELIRDPVALIHDVRCLVEKHRHDNPEAAITGNAVLPPPPPLTIADRVCLSLAKPYAINPDLLILISLLDYMIGAAKSGAKRFCKDTKASIREVRKSVSA